MSRPQFKPTKKQRVVAKLHAIAGTPQIDIAKLILNPETGEPITDKTLRRAFRDELNLGLAELKARAVGVIAQKLNDNDLGAACFVLKTRAGWSERSTHELVGANGGPIAITRIEEVIIDPSDTKPEEA